MDTPKIHESEYRFCLIMWEKEPIRSPELVRLCKERLGWKETTAYTVMKRLEERGVLKVENKIVTSLFSKDQIQQAELDEFVTKTFEGSAGFVRKRHRGDPAHHPGIRRCPYAKCIS